MATDLSALLVKASWLALGWQRQRAPNSRWPPLQQMRSTGRPAIAIAKLLCDLHHRCHSPLDYRALL